MFIYHNLLILIINHMFNFLEYSFYNYNIIKIILNIKLFINYN